MKNNIHKLQDKPLWPEQPVTESKWKSEAKKYCIL